MVYHPHLINLSFRAIPCRTKSSLCLRENSEKGGRADVPDPAEPGLGLYLSTPCDTHSPQEKPFYKPEHKHGHL